MRNWRHWAMQAVLLLGLGAAVAQAADKDDRSRYPKPPTDPTSNWGWMNPATWFGGGKEKKDKAADAKAKKTAKKDEAKSDATPLPSPADEARGRRSREEADLCRRLKVCDGLREIALRNEDQELLRRVDELSDRAFALYTQRTGARAPVSGALTDLDLPTLDSARDAEALTRRRPADEPVYSVTTEKTKRGAPGKEVDR